MSLLAPASQPSHPAYRPDIDGLRAIAVLAVVAFHAFGTVLPGGFIGVDVFFVISGYLIATILFTQLEQGCFSLMGFYARRIRRIFPALLLVLFASYGLGWLTLLPGEDQQLGKHIAAGAGFVANLALWREAGYFDNSAETKPLLHLWSLSVEEQFYILWPLLLCLAWRRKFTFFRILKESEYKGSRKYRVLAVIAVLGLGSFYLSVTTADRVVLFYAPQTRFWELLCGSLLAWGCLYQRAPCLAFKTALPAQGRWVPHLLSGLGLVLLLGGFFGISKAVAFPGIWALVPVLAAVLIIAAGPQAWVNRTLLARRGMVWLGLISFPLYLWHWPLLSFARILGNEPARIATRIGAVLLAIVLAWLTWRLVEQPVRLGQKNPVKTRTLVLLMLGMASLGGYSYACGGWVWMVPWQGKNAAALIGYNGFNGKSEAAFWQGGCFNLSENSSAFQNHHCDEAVFAGRPTVFLVGDSHSAYLSQYLKGYLQARRYNFVQFSAGYCTPLSVLDHRQRCQEINRYVWQRIAAEHPEFLILSAHYLLWSDDPHYGEAAPYDRFINAQMARLKQLGVKEIFILGQMPTWQDGLPAVLLRRFVRHGRPIPPRTYQGVVPLSLAWDTKMAAQPYPQGVHYLSLKNALCNKAGCLTMAGPNLGTDLLVFDYGHLTFSGAKWVTEQLLAPYFP